MIVISINFQYNLLSLPTFMGSSVESPVSSIQSLVNTHPEVRNTRRAMLRANAFTAASGVIALLSVPDILLGEITRWRARTRFDRSNPPVPEIQLVATEVAQVRDYLRTAEVHLENNNLDGAEEVLHSTPVVSLQGTIEAKTAQDSATLLANETQRLDEQDRYADQHDTYPVRPAIAVPSGIVAATGSSIGALVYSDRKGEYKKLGKPIEDTVTTLHPEWKTSHPTEEELQRFFRAISYLPPVGFKIPDATDKYNKKTEKGAYPPVITAEQQAAQVIWLRRKGRIGQEYVHQITVQGRMPDRFKFAALALIMGSHLRDDWNTPFHTAPWGQVAPLIHDGGNVERSLSRGWENVHGRTDFLHRRSFIEEPEIARIEALSSAQKFELPADELQRVVYEKLLEDLVRSDVRFYQRAALALHAAEGTLPSHVPAEVRENASVAWSAFEDQMKAIFTDYGMEDMSRVVWFYDEGEEEYRAAWNHDRRREAGWTKIKEQLEILQGRRDNNPELEDLARERMDALADAVDIVIGLKQDPTIAEGNHGLAA